MDGSVLLLLAFSAVAVVVLGLLLAPLCRSSVYGVRCELRRCSSRRDWRARVLGRRAC